MEGDMFHHNGGHNWAWYYLLIFKSYSVTKDKNIYISQQTLDIALDIWHPKQVHSNTGR